MDVSEVADAVIGDIPRTSSSTGCPAVAVSGFPTCGKTTLAREISLCFADKSLFIDIDYWILDYEMRKERGISGASPMAYEVLEAVKSILSLRRREDAVVHEYDHFTKRRRNDGIRLSAAGKEIMVIDGCILIDDRFLGCYDYLVFLLPRSKSQWLKNSVYRDTRFRFFSSDEARVHNISKFRDMMGLLETGYENIDSAFSCEGLVEESSTSFVYSRVETVGLERLKASIGE